MEKLYSPITHIVFAVIEVTGIAGGVGLSRRKEERSSPYRDLASPAIRLLEVGQFLIEVIPWSSWTLFLKATSAWM